MNARFCSRCGTPHAEGSRFCGGCGQPLGAPVAAPASPAPTMPPGVPSAPAGPRRFGARAFAFGAAALIVVMAIPLVRGLDLGADGEKIELVSARSEQERSDGERFKIALLKVITSYGVAAVESLSVVHLENGLTRVRSISIKPAPGVDPNMLLGLTADSLLRLFRPGYYRINGVEVWVQDPKLSTAGNDLRALQAVANALRAQVLASLTFDGTYRTTVDFGTGAQRIPVPLVFEVKDRAVGGSGTGQATVPAPPQFDQQTGENVFCRVAVAFRPVGTVDERGQMTGTLPGSAHITCLRTFVGDAGPFAAARRNANPNGQVLLDSDVPQDCDAPFEASLDRASNLGGHITDCKGASSGFQLKKD